MQYSQCTRKHYQKTESRHKRTDSPIATYDHASQKKLDRYHHTAGVNLKTSAQVKQQGDCHLHASRPVPNFADGSQYQHYAQHRFPDTECCTQLVYSRFRPAAAWQRDPGRNRRRIPIHPWPHNTAPSTIATAKGSAAVTALRFLVNTDTHLTEACGSPVIARVRTHRATNNRGAHLAAPKSSITPSVVAMLPKPTTPDRTM